MRIARRVFRIFRWTRFFYARPFEQLSLRGAMSAQAIRAFYLVMPCLLLMNYQYYHKFFQPISGQLWPIELLNAFGAFQHPRALIGLLHIFAALPIFFPWSRLARFGAFVTTLVFVAMANSQVDIGHWAHIWVFASFWLFVICPSPNSSRRRFSYLNVLALAVIQAQWCAIYFAAGVHKFKALSLCMFESGCAPLSSSLSYLMAGEHLATSLVPLLAPLLVDSPILNTLGIISVLLFQLGALFLVVRPTWTFTVGVLSIGFHLGGYFFIGPNFLSTAAAIGILFLLPSSPPALTLSKLFNNLSSKDRT